MALALYSKPIESAAFSNDSTFSKPFTVTFDGRKSGAIDTKLYIRNDDITKYYEDIVIQLVDTSGDDITNNTYPNFYIKLMEKDAQPTQDEWDQITAGQSLSLSTSEIGISSLGDTSTYLGFWIRISTPRNQPMRSIKDVTVRLVGTEKLVT